MALFSRDQIISEIIRTTRQNGGFPLGAKRFETETGIKRSDWAGKFWARWGDALIEAGFQPNVFTEPRSEDELLDCLALFSRELGHFPVSNEIRIRARNEPGFPWHNTFARFGKKRELALRLREFSLKRGYEDVVCFCDAVIAVVNQQDKTDNTASTVIDDELGYVYLVKSGRFYKIGRTNSVGRRERELTIQLPEKAACVHSIKTDDPIGIEAYWHKRFVDRHKNGEWFELTAKDIAAFRRRKFM